LPPTPRTLPAWPEPQARRAAPPRQALLRVALALGGIAVAVLAVAALAWLPWTVWSGAIAALALLATALTWGWRRHRAPARARRWYATTSGTDLVAQVLPERDEDTLLPALLPLAERRGRTLAAHQGRLTVHVGPGVAQVRLPLATVQNLAQLLLEALDAATRPARTGTRLRFELDLRHGETGSHLRLAVIGPRRTVTNDSTSVAPSDGTASQRRSVASMQRLATALGAQLDIELGPRGVCVEWVLPLAVDSQTVA
jgi:hypothetical protein